MTQFYSEKAVFITGATGFMGKCLLEKILRSLPDVTQVMILVRPKRGKSMKERMDSLLKSKVRIYIWLGLAVIALVAFSVLQFCY